MDKLVELENQIDQKTDFLYALKIEIGDMIERLENPIHRIVLTDYYISGKTWDEVAAQIHYSRQHVMRIKKKAIREVEALLNG
jgi:DNA-directed RNA polymerase specialized sigma subunit